MKIISARRGARKLFIRDGFRLPTRTRRLSRRERAGGIHGASCFHHWRHHAATRTKKLPGLLLLSISSASGWMTMNIRCPWRFDRMEHAAPECSNYFRWIRTCCELMKVCSCVPNLRPSRLYGTRLRVPSPRCVNDRPCFADSYWSGKCVRWIDSRHPGRRNIWRNWPSFQSESAHRRRIWRWNVQTECFRVLNAVPELPRAPEPAIRFYGWRRNVCDNVAEEPHRNRWSIPTPRCGRPSERWAEPGRGW